MSRSRTIRLLGIAFLAACAGVSATSGAQPNGGFDPNKPATPEQIKEWVKKLEEQPDHPLPKYKFNLRAEAYFLARRGGDAARPAVLGLLQDPTKPGQARAQAAVVLVQWLLGEGAKQ